MKIRWKTNAALSEHFRNLIDKLYRCEIDTSRVFTKTNHISTDILFADEHTLKPRGEVEWVGWAQIVSMVKIWYRVYPTLIYSFSMKTIPVLYSKTKLIPIHVIFSYW